MGGKYMDYINDVIRYDSPDGLFPSDSPDVGVLVVDLPLWKMMEWKSVGMMILPNWMESHNPFVFQASNHIYIISLYIIGYIDNYIYICTQAAYTSFDVSRVKAWDFAGRLGHWVTPWMGNPYMRWWPHQTGHTSLDLPMWKYLEMKKISSRPLKVWKGSWEFRWLFFGIS